MAGETMDCADLEQLSVCMRYVRDGKVYERLLQLVEASYCSGAGIARQLLEILVNVGINRNFMVGQCYDGTVLCLDIKWSSKTY